MNLKQISSKKYFVDSSADLFGRCREEEKMRNITQILKEVKEKPSLSHLFITFEEIKRDLLIFYVLIIFKGKEKIKTLIQRVDPTLLFLSEREQVFCEIKICSFFLGLKIDQRFIRRNRSIHYPLIRKELVHILKRSLGEMRDYNGSLFIQKQERIEELQLLFSNVDRELLEEFFYHLEPVKMQFSLSLDILTSFFEFFLKMFKKKECFFCFSKTLKGGFIYLTSKDPDALFFLKVKIESYDEIDFHSLISTFYTNKGKTHLYFYTNQNEDRLIEILAKIYKDQSF